MLAFQETESRNRLRNEMYLLFYVVARWEVGPRFLYPRPCEMLEGLGKNTSDVQPCMYERRWWHVCRRQGRNTMSRIANMWWRRCVLFLQEVRTMEGGALFSWRVDVNVEFGIHDIDFEYTGGLRTALKARWRPRGIMLFGWTLCASLDGFFATSTWLSFHSRWEDSCTWERWEGGG